MKYSTLVPTKVIFFRGVGCAGRVGVLGHVDIRVSNLVVYAQSTNTVISKRDK